jgi:hypothetical protein
MKERMKKIFKDMSQLDVVAHTFNPSTQEAEAGRFLSSRPTWSTKVSPRTARAIQRNPVSKNKNKNKEARRKIAR